jgi:hypothetical protein
VSHRTHRERRPGPGQDGTFSDNHYDQGGFPSVETGKDLVWLDGFFIRWPERKPNP